ncbi:MAG: ABC transporter [Bacteroidetes bacterium GWF2_38_335]|nr:MAG: ABC transporter [Bacteroidetes bacterium GWF2_38_335]OFY76912.1 MAG: ABC transporter [Bacteroidetes bacterium RIFOXYA12_FULL_38_20]HBS86761.1 ABC transporter permease [Bacteroidales bacterium]
MKTIIYLIQKEFIQIFRDKIMLRMMFVLPIVMLIVLVNAATQEMKSISLFVVDNDLSETSRELTGKFSGSPFFKISGNSFSVKKAESEILKDNADMILVIPHGFERNLVTGQNAAVQIQINAINGMVAGLINAYSSQIISGYNQNIIRNQVPGFKARGINITNSFWYNPGLNYKIYMVPGILVLLVTIVGMFLTAINIVREKEMGTIEQINVTPIQKYQFIIGKMIPFWVVAMIELSVGLTIGKIFYQIPIEGNLLILFSIAAIYLFVALGFGLFISTMANTQQQTMFLSFFFLVLFILMSGLFTPTESMPYWAQIVNYINPVAVFLKAIRMILLKGSGYADLIPQIVHLSIYAVAIISLAIFRYRKTAA